MWKTGRKPRRTIISEDFIDWIVCDNLKKKVLPKVDYWLDTHIVGTPKMISGETLKEGLEKTAHTPFRVVPFFDPAPWGGQWMKEVCDLDNPDEMIAALNDSQQTGKPFDTEKYVNKWPAKRHDHYLIPAGTVHCSGAGAMVLEISATPSIFTFKLWDWGRLGLDGLPRPINIGHGSKVIQWERQTEFVRHNLINQVEMIAEGADWLA